MLKLLSRVKLVLIAIMVASLSVVAIGGESKGLKPIASAQEQKRMKNYLSEIYRGIKIVHTFLADTGEKVACVDAFNQPAFNNRKLQKHEIQWKPSHKVIDRYKGKSLSDEKTKDALAGYSGMLRGDKDVSGKRRSCPLGTVPLVMLSLEALARFPTLEAFLAKYPKGKGEPDDKSDRELKPEDNVGPSDLHQYAYVREYVDNWGTESVFNVWSPYVERSNEFSLSQLWVVRGTGSDKETIESGWQVYRDKYGDNRARLFLYFTPDAYGSGGCYNLDCSGFVQVANNIYIGGGFTNYSEYNSTQYIFKLLWVRDPANGNWWLRYFDTWVGYYPNELFDSNGLRDKSDKLTYGGEIIDRQTSDRHTYTDMGSGNFPSEGWSKAAYQRSIRYVDTNYYYRSHTGLFEARDDVKCYDIDLRNSSGSWGDYFYFGGEGYHGTECQ